MEFVESPPADGRLKYDWPTILAELRANPGMWGVLTSETGAPQKATAAQAKARAIRKGMLAGTEKGEFEAMSRGTVVYARYVGNNQASE